MRSQTVCLELVFSIFAHSIQYSFFAWFKKNNLKPLPNTFLFLRDSAIPLIVLYFKVLFLHIKCPAKIIYYKATNCQVLCHLFRRILWQDMHCQFIFHILKIPSHSFCSLLRLFHSLRVQTKSLGWCFCKDMTSLITESLHFHQC